MQRGIFLLQELVFYRTMCSVAQWTGVERNSMQIAIYGKGGIGKSTVSANLSAALAAQGSSGALYLPEQLLNGVRMLRVWE